MTPRVLFSAHGLPERMIAAGDPYRWQVEETVRRVVETLAIPGLDHQVCFQSRVGPLRWIGPATDDEIRRAGADKVPVVVVPVAFVSEHSETLVELDIDYRRLAEDAGVPLYIRVPTVDTLTPFIESLVQMIRSASESGTWLQSGEGGKICPAAAGKCPFSTMAIA